MESNFLEKVKGHTSGEFNNNLNDGQVFDSGGMLVGHCYSSLRGPATVKANARLFSKAYLLPELYRLLDRQVKEAELNYESDKAEADWYNNNVPGVGQGNSQYLTCEPLPEWVVEAKKLLDKMNNF